MILVTGGAGFIGSEFVRSVEEECIILDRLTYAGDPQNVAATEHIFIHGDICDRILVKHILYRYRPTAIVHFAAESHVDTSFHNPEHFFNTNVIGTMTLLEEARLWGTKFLHISTDEVYGSLPPDHPPFTEESPYRPSNPYAASKAASDLMVRCFNKSYGLPTIITNCGNNYGENQHPEKLIPKFVRMAKRGEPMTLHGDGMDVRDWIHVSDHCSALRLLLKKGTWGESYNIGANEEHTNLHIAEQISDAILRSEMVKTEIAFIPDRMSQDRRYAINASKLRALGWVPSASFDESLVTTIRWYINNF